MPSLLNLNAALGSTLTLGSLTQDSSRFWLESVPGGYAITAVHLALQARIEGVDPQTFERLVAVAKENCPVSKVLNATITLEAELLNGPPVG
jgi:lipoyl-dependent peroxiredoxin